MRTILEELYYGNICPNTDLYCHNRRRTQAQDGAYEAYHIKKKSRCEHTETEDNITRVMWLKSGNRYQIRFDANKKRAQQKAFRRSFFEKMYERRFCHAIF